MALRFMNRDLMKFLWLVVSCVAVSFSVTTADVQAADRTRRVDRTIADFGPPPGSDWDLEVDADRLPSRDRPLRALDQGPNRTRGRDPAEELPSLQMVPATRPSADEPSLEQKITRRYQDARVLRVLSELDGPTGEAFYREVSQMIDNRHIEPTSYGQRIHAGFEHLQLAVSNPVFQQATRIRPSQAQLRVVQSRLAAMQAETRVRNQSDAIAAIRQVGRMAQQSIGLNPGAVYFEFVYASLDSLDKFSMLLPPEKSGQVSLGLDETLVGIGAEIESNPSGLRILKAFPGGPAAEATLKKGDLITAVDGQPLAGMEMSQAVDLISGRAGTPVRLKLRRDNMMAELTLVRRQIEVRSISEVRMLDSGSHVGYIKLDQFAESSTRELDAALWKLHNAGMESLVLDLRGNPGGYLTTAIEISDRFLPSGTIVSTRGRNRDDNSHESATRPNTWKVPLVVLIDHDSASASEILAAAIQENSRGLIVGETSYGKDTVQTLMPLNSVNAGLRLTTAKFYSPGGRVMAGVGVAPDVKVRTGTSDDDAAMLQAALEATQDPDLQLMADNAGKSNRTSLRVIEVAVGRTR